jgi:ferredoxin-NADP reductase
VAESAPHQPAAPHEPGHVIERPSEYFVVVRDATVESEGVRSYVFERTDGEPLPEWEPGAHIEVIMPELERQFSLCGDPALETWKVGVLLEPESRGGSQWMHENVEAGMQLRVRGPRNNFPLVQASSYIMIAGGIGITPILAMVRDLDETGDDWQLLYGGRARKSMAFLDELEAFGDRVRIWPQDETGLLDLKTLLAEPQEDTVVYCCGPEPLLAAVESNVEHWPPHTLHLERFKPRPGALEGERTAFEVVLDYSGLSILVREDQTIAEAVEAAGVAVDTSCREGTCGTCETYVLEGVPDHRDSFLREDERADNETMMICCSRSRSPRLVLDL